MPESGRAPAEALLQPAAARLRAGGAVTPDLDARLLLAEAAGMPASAMHRHALLAASPDLPARFAAFLERRLAGEPVHRIIGRRAFYDHEFLLSPDTLEPRPDTEILVDEASEAVAASIAVTGQCVFADIGTGTGAIAVSLLALHEAATALATDISEAALVTARQNAEAAGVARRMLPVRMDYLAGLAGPLDLLVSNPPYIPHHDIASLAREVRDHDPLRALDGGADGLVAYRSIAEFAAAVVRVGGEVIVEIGIGQGPSIEEIFRDKGFVFVRTAKDLGGKDRVLRFRSPGRV
ncbi:peptide chain release factor N(5)-glutamine methyltransferase [Aurantimonas aggregata]|uniref:Release factor glutamine methyltransferase n=1 Tax=Aurantimonas aggregata TaxID=2047720 RepID=A0A6L9MLE9_9HYPH|nr:peptide chain release factor N(5)-glutamine methyltransferase [Aurantimonas aggregata]NDV88679.1 peptide chain release factor N(5)-glutamine methyltransferase [Aurantimonas aggregata]